MYDKQRSVYEYSKDNLMLPCTGLVRPGQYCIHLYSCSYPLSPHHHPSHHYQSPYLCLPWVHMYPRITLTSSLPSHFRFAPTTPTLSTLPFFNRTDDDDSFQPVQTVDQTPPKIRLEVMKGWEVSLTVLCLYAVSVLALIYVCVKMRYAIFQWNTNHVIPDLLPPEIILRFLLEIASVFLPVFFCISVLLAPHVTDEQIWTLILLAVGLCSTNPLTRSLTAPLQTTRLIIDDAVYTAAIYLYLSLAAHSYRIFDNKYIHSLEFYLPKLAAASIYLFIKLFAGFQANVSLGLIPYSRLLTWFILQQSGRTSLTITIPVMLTTILDTAFAFWLVKEVAATAEFLETVPYVEHRAKQLGFRCFVYQTLAFCFNMISLSTLSVYLTPAAYIYEAYDDPQGTLLQLEPPVARLALALIYCTWTFVIAFVNLPPTQLLPFVQQLCQTAVWNLRNNRIAVWLGLADMVTTEDAEDSDDGSEPTSSQPPVRHTKTIPLRYRHRELFDQIICPPSPLFLSTPLPPLSPDPRPPCASSGQLPPARAPSQTNPPARAGSLPSNRYPAAKPIDIIDANSRFRPQSSLCIDDFSSIFSPRARCALSRSESPRVVTPRVGATKRLRLRKNLFVMETAVMMANMSYLSYIPGNELEERISKRKMPQHMLHTGSLSSDLDDLARQIEEENRSLRNEDPEIMKEDVQPATDDGTMFLVEPYEMAERYGFKLYRHMKNDVLNTHVLVLVSSSRVVVAVSGTRDVTNWKSNTNMSRAVLDDRLTRFEYELAEDAQVSVEEDPSLLSLDNFDYASLQDHARVNSSKSSAGSGSLRRTRSEVVIDDREEDSLLGQPSRPQPLTHGRAIYGSTTIPNNDEAPMYPRRDDAGPVSQNGVTMFATAFAKEFLTFGQAKVHVGFIDAYMSVRKQIMGTLIEIYKGRKSKGGPSNATGIANSLPLFFCGHSLGGAIATLGAYEAARYYKRIGISRRQDISCTTFGCPRVGNEAFKMRYERLVETHWRFEMAADPIPRVSNVFLNYVPVGVQILMDQSGMLLIDPSFIEVQWWGRLANLYLGYRLHTRASYSMALMTFCRRYKDGGDDLDDKFWPFPIRVQTKGLFRNVLR